MTGSAWLGGLLTVTSLLAAGVLAVAARGRRGDRPACLAHATMSLGMAGMFAPWGDPVPAAVGVATFALIGAWFAARLLRRAAGSGADALHLVVGPAAMILMYGTHEHGTGMADPAPDGSGHAGHGSALTSDGGSLPLTVLTLGLAAYFGWHAWTSAAPAGGQRDEWSSIRFAHVVMSVLMAAMLLGVP